MNNNLVAVTFFISIKIALLATIISLITGTFLARFLSNKKSFTAVMIELLISIPIFMPPTVMGYYLLVMLGKYGIIGGIFSKYFGINIIFTQFSAVIASGLASLPILYKTVKSFFESSDPEVINAAKVDGADRFQILFFIEIPLAFKGILSGIMLAFLRGLGEFGITLMIAGNIPFKTQTISLGIYDKVMSGKVDETNVFALLLCFISVCIIIAIRFLDDKFMKGRS